jgi:hypothetical protein
MAPNSTAYMSYNFTCQPMGAGSNRFAPVQMDTEEVGRNPVSNTTNVMMATVMFRDFVEKFDEAKVFAIPAYCPTL